MKALSLATLTCIASLAVSTAAGAEQCSAQIKALQKQVSAPPSGASGNIAAGTQNSRPKSAPPNAAAAQDALNHAKQLDQAGHEAECQAEVIKAKAAFGAQ